ncbi:MAG: sensor histidine kinase, partial [Mycobacterium sp.]
MRPLDQPRSTADLDEEHYGLARIVVAVRVAVVVSVGLVLLVGPDWIRRHVIVTVAVLTCALAYSVVMMANPRLEVRRTRYVWLISSLDAGFTLVLIALTGGLHSPVAAVLVLVVITSAARLSFVETLAFAVLLGAAYILVARITTPNVELARPSILEAGWTALYLVIAAILSAGLSALAEREERSRIRALVEAEAEHAAAEEERDLRARLLQSYQSQQDGLQVLVHEFRTPIASLAALMDALTSPSPMSDADRDTGLQLAGRHAHHIADMLDALSDVALSRRPTFSAGPVRRIDIAEVIIAAADAVRLTPPRLRLTAT